MWQSYNGPGYKGVQGKANKLEYELLGPLYKGMEWFQTIRSTLKWNF